MNVPNFLGICMIMELCVTNKPPALKMYVKKNIKNYDKKTDTCVDFVGFPNFVKLQP